MLLLTPALPCTNAIQGVAQTIEFSILEIVGPPPVSIGTFVVLRCHGLRNARREQSGNVVVGHSRLTTFLGRKEEKKKKCYYVSYMMCSMKYDDEEGKRRGGGRRKSGCIINIY